MTRTRLDLRGARAGRLIAISPSTKSVMGNVLWHCRCDCGNECLVKAAKLQSKRAKSCGCLWREHIKHGAKTHGHTQGRRKTREYACWSTMRARCSQPTAAMYYCYGARGIKVCDRWENSFENFLEDMGDKPPGKSIERIDNDGDYCPENCKWATDEEQANNKSNSTFLLLNGERKTLTQWARVKGIQQQTLSARMKMGWSAERALTAPVRKARAYRSRAGTCMTDRPILDVACGSRMFWFDHDNQSVIFHDKRKETHTLKDKSSKGGTRELIIDPDMVGDFRSLQFPDNRFSLVVFDPPHLTGAGKSGWLAKKYGVLEGDWREDIRKGFAECFRVLRPDGTLIFKWNEEAIPVADILSLTPVSPLFGNRCGRTAKSHWIVFMKPQS